MEPLDRKMLVAKLRDAGLPQSFFTQKTNIDKSAQLASILRKVWTNDKGDKLAFTTPEKQEATEVWG